MPRWSHRWRSLACTLLVSAAACGGGGGGDDGPNPTPTVTPITSTTPTPVGTTSVAVMRIAAQTASVQGVQLAIAYPTSKGGFGGSGDQVSCGTPTSGTVTLNDRDDGTLVFSIARATALVFPIELRCTFVAVPGARLAANDVNVGVTEVTTGNAVGNPSDVSVNVTVE
jgi:hypothetical protein